MRRGSDLLPYELFIEELRTDEAERQLGAISRLRLIALALGPEKTCDPLVKNLSAWIEEHVTGDPSAPCPDEVLTCIAFNLGKFVADGLVGPASNLPLLVKPLERLCSVDETNVREEAVKSLNIICKRMEPAQVKSELQPIILGLAKSDSGWVPRVSACGLFATAMGKLSADEGSSKELREARAAALYAPRLPTSLASPASPLPLRDTPLWPRWPRPPPSPSQTHSPSHPPLPPPSPRECSSPGADATRAPTRPREAGLQGAGDRRDSDGAPRVGAAALRLR